jgi:hypothetical protein
MRWRAFGAVVISLALSGCGTLRPANNAGCRSEKTIQGTHFCDHGDTTSLRMRPLGTAQPWNGSTAIESGQPMTVQAFHGVSPDRAIGVREPGRQIETIYLSEYLTRWQRERIVVRLTLSMAQGP